MIGYLSFDQMLAFLGGKSRAWGRLHVHEIPHLKLYDRLLFDPAELRAWVQATAERHVPLDINRIVAEAMPGRTRKTVRNAA
jgi:hypothetical protein